MDSIVGVMKKIAENEAHRVHTTELGIVTAVFPHTGDSDKDNYQCSVKLKNRTLPDGGDFELRKVPVATPYIGLAAIPNVGDLVLVCFIGGDILAPVITGRLYNDEDRPPLNQKQEFLLQHTIKEGGSIHLDKNGKVVLTSKNKKNVFTVEDEKISVKTPKYDVAVEGGTVTIGNGTCTIKLDDSGIAIDAGAKPIDIKTAGPITIGGANPQPPVCNNDNIILSTHTHMGNLGAPCPILVPTDTIVSLNAMARSTKVG